MNCLFAALCLAAVTAAAPAVPPVVSVGRTQLHVCSDTVIRVTHTPTGVFPNRTMLIAKQTWEPVKYTKTEDADSVTVTTAMVRAVVNKASGAVSFFDAKNGKRGLRSHSSAAALCAVAGSAAAGEAARRNTEAARAGAAARSWKSDFK